MADASNPASCTQFIYSDAALGPPPQLSIDTALGPVFPVLEPCHPRESGDPFFKLIINFLILH